MVKHPVVLRGYAPGEPADAPGWISTPPIVKRTDAEFLPGLLDGLSRKSRVEELGRPDSDPSGDGHLRLLQPVHRAFNLVVFEATCARPGFPRLNPRSIESAGLVVRRIPRAATIPSPGKFGRALQRIVSTLPGEEAWQHRNDQPVGWSRLSDPLLDPDPSRRPRLVTANAVVNQRLGEILRRLEPLGERIHPLFVAPPEVCEAAGRTLLYGVVPVTSREQVDRNDAIEVTDDDVQQIMPAFLRALGRDGRPAVSGAFPDLATLNNLSTAQPNHPAVQFLQELRLIQFAWRAFDTEEGAGIVNLLNRISLRFRDPAGQVPLGDYLKEACARLVLRNSTPATIALPDEWPQPDAALAREIRQAVLRSVRARLAQDIPPASRFEDETAGYVARGFIRVRCEDGCPPALHWSEPSAPFRIAPWWENGGPVHTISLPDLDPEKIKKLKPNVAFALPPKLANLLNNMNPEDLLKGKGSMNGPSLGWICSFSLPVITLCAFIVLNIFLSLLHLVFQWLFYIKICLPFPRRSS